MMDTNNFPFATIQECWKLVVEPLDKIGAQKVGFATDKK
jgi:hypothetical protein